MDVGKGRGEKQAYDTKPSSAGTERVVGVLVFLSPPVATQKQSQDRDLSVLGGQLPALVPPGRVSLAKPR